MLMLSFCSVAYAGSKEEALNVVEKWTSAFSASDVDGIVKLYAPDALFFGTGSKTLVSNPAGIRTYFEKALLTDRPKTATLAEPAITVLSNKTVVVTGLDRITGVKDGQTYTLNGRVTFVVAKRSNTWQIIHFHRSAVPN
jgi:uncharacterized protein (TIGR02246 family)